MGFFQITKKNKIKLAGRGGRSAWFVVVEFALIFALFLFTFKIWDNYLVSQSSQLPIQYLESKEFIPDSSKEIPLVLAEETESAGQNESPGQTFNSENFKLSEVYFSGEPRMEMNNIDQDLPLEILKISGRLVNDKKEEKLSFILDWQSNRPCECAVNFSAQSEKNSRSIEEEKPDYSHSVALRPLDYSSVYSYSISCKDDYSSKWQSDKFVFYTGAKDMSLVDLLTDSAQDIFGWAMK